MTEPPPIDLGDAVASLHLGDTSGSDFRPPPSAEMHRALLPLSWLLGTWRGHGRGDYPTVTEFSYGQEVTFSHHGKPLLEYVSRSWSLDGENRPLAVETGYIRPRPEGGIEAVIAHGAGIVEVAYGSIEGVKLELASDLVGRTSTALEVTGLHRLYGLLEGVLLYAIDMSAMGQPLQPHLWARLYRSRD